MAAAERRVGLLGFRIMTPLRYFFNDSRAVGVLLICCTLLSLVIANSGIGSFYMDLWHHPLASLSSIPESSAKWINDFLMSFFFLLAGMEIKRELLSGELSSFKKAILPFGAALGGMLLPAMIYLLFNLQSGFVKGWGIPTATDIAFSLGVASLLGKKVPVGLKILLMAIAIIDDLGAIIVIALFYGGHIQWLYLGAGALLYAALWACNLLKLRFGVLEIVISLLLWFTIFSAGIEASISGVLVAFATPVASLPKIEKWIHGPVNFVILPLFALANTAILIPPDITTSLTSSISMGVFFGLVLGKPIGIFLFSRLMVFLKMAHLPSNTSWRGIFGMGTLAGIGFTMSIFTTTLAFSGEGERDIAKIAILVGMLASLAFSWVYFGLLSRKTSVAGPERQENQLTTVPGMAVT